MGLEEAKTGEYVTFESCMTRVRQLEKKIKQLEKEIEHYEGDDSCIFEVDFGDERN
jgi:hypothetical protein